MEIWRGVVAASWRMKGRRKRGWRGNEVLKDEWRNWGGKRSGAVTDICLMKWKVSAKWGKRHMNESKTPQRGETHLLSGVWSQILMESNGSLECRPPSAIVNPLPFTCALPRWCHISTYFPTFCSSYFLFCLTPGKSPVWFNQTHSHWGLSASPQGHLGDHFVWRIFWIQRFPLVVSRLLYPSS